MPVSKKDNRNALPIIHDVTIKSPCHQNWDEMDGDAAKRFCGLCRKHVHNFSEMSAEEVNQLLATDDKVCVRFRRKPDGTILTKSPIVSRRGWLARATACAASVVALISFGGCNEDAIGPPLTGEPVPNPSPNPPTALGQTQLPEEMGDVLIMGGPEVPPEIQSGISMGGIGGSIRNLESKNNNDESKK